MNKLIISLMIVLGASTVSSAGECKTESTDLLMAEYEITEQHEGAHEHTRTIRLWRMGKQVGIERVDDGIFEQWNRLPNNRIRGALFVDHNKRGIEYDPEIMPVEESDQIWQTKWTLLSPTVIKKMDVQSKTEQDCFKMVSYQAKSKDSKITWNESLNLLVNFSYATADGKTEWRLKDLSFDTDKVSKNFDLRDRYNTIDFADVGDMENDPFVNKMIKLGFLESQHDH